MALLYENLTGEIMGAAVEVHKTLGPGFPEKVYQVSFEHELGLRDIPFVAQKQIIVQYKGIIAAEYFIDLIVDDKVIVELKALSDFEPIHQSQVISYLKATNLKVAMLLNFGQRVIKSRRVVL